MENQITIKLTQDEALVLFELLSRINKDSKSDLFEDQAEQRILWDLESSLECSLVEPFQPDYHQAIQKAREVIRDREKK